LQYVKGLCYESNGNRNDSYECFINAYNLNSTHQQYQEKACISYYLLKDKTYKELLSKIESWGSFNELRKRTDDDALAILDEAIKEEETSGLKDASTNVNITDQQKAVYIYKSYTDLETRNKNGITPLKPYLDKIYNIKNLNDVQNFIIETQPSGGGGFYGLYIGSHPKNSNINTAFLYPAGLGLSRNYYVDKDEDTKEKMQKYTVHVGRMLAFFGDDKEKAKSIVAFETALSSPRMTKEDRRDARKRYNPMTIEEIAKLTPSINFDKYIKGIGIQKIDTVIVTDPNYFKALENVLKTSSVQDWKDYLKWTTIDRAAGALSEEIDVANWDFYSKTLRGAKEQRPLNERALSTLNGSVGEALGKLYVDKKFPPEAKVKAEKMIKNIIKAFGNRIKKLDWMSDETKEKALVKLGKMTVKIAYPDQWKDYSKMKINKTNSYFENQLAVAKYRFDKNVAKIGKPVDKTEWHMSPQTVNAYFNPPNNEIVFPAAILQPPFYNYLADEAVNYGGIGAVIGHEISHSFDDSGSRYDGDGNLNNWWTESDSEQFAILGKQLEEQYAAVEALPGINLNGKYTLGENIGDLGGVNVAYEGLQLYYKENGRPDNIDGFSGEQRFFMSCATVWRTKMRDDALKNLIKTNTHSPGMYRGYMPLQNIDEFYAAFEIKENDEMYLKPKDRVKIW
jgi:predicted metalloendopeptidase